MSYEIVHESRPVSTFLDLFLPKIRRFEEVTLMKSLAYATLTYLCKYKSLRSSKKKRNKIKTTVVQICGASSRVPLPKVTCCTGPYEDFLLLFP